MGPLWRIQELFILSQLKLLDTSIKFFETLGVIRIKHRLTKSNIFLDDECEDFDDKDFAVNRKSECDSNATQKDKVVIENNIIFKEDNNEKGNNVSTTCTA